MRYFYSTLIALVLAGCQQRVPPVAASPSVSLAVKTEAKKEELFYRRPLAQLPVTHLPLLRVGVWQEALQNFFRDPVVAQPWRQQVATTPTTLTDLGLRGKLTLVLMEAEWSFVKIIVIDAGGRMFAFCATDDRGQPDGYGGAFLLGDIKPSRQLIRAAPGTASYQFLFSLVWSFSKDPRYQHDDAFLDRVRVRLGLTEEDFARFMQEPSLEGL